MLATLGPISDEIIVAPSTVLRAGPGAGQFALSFAIPCGQPGLKFICRESFDLGRTPFDHPLGSRFEEMDAIVLFDDVLVPWERLFLLDDVELANSAYAATNAVVHMMHQVVVKNVAKAEFVLGVACLVAETLGSEQSPQVQERISEIILDLEVMRACLRASEADAAPDEWGVTCPARMPLDAARNLFPRMYPRMVEILQLLGSSSLMALADFGTELEPDLSATWRPALPRVSSVCDCSAWRGTWRAAHSARQVLYERYFFGDPSRMASACTASTTRSRSKRVRLQGWFPPGVGLRRRSTPKIATACQRIRSATPIAHPANRPILPESLYKLTAVLRLSSKLAKIRSEPQGSISSAFEYIRRG